MEYRSLGTTGLTTSIIGWGTVKLSVREVSPSEVHKMSMSKVRLR